MNWLHVEGWAFLDPATRTGVCLVKGGEPEVFTVRVDKSVRRELSLYRYQQELVELLKRTDPEIVCVEDYPAHARGASLHGLVEVGTCARQAAVEAGAKVVNMNPRLWKSITFNEKKANKEQQLVYLYKTEQITGMRVDNVDEADALLMAWAADTILRDTTRWTKGMEKFRIAVRGCR